MAKHNFDNDMDRWHGKSPDEVLAEAFHELRDPIYTMTGYLNVLKSMDLPPDEMQDIIAVLWNSVSHSKNIVDSVYHYFSEHGKVES